MKNIFGLTFMLLLSACSTTQHNSFVRSSSEKLSIQPNQVLYVEADFQNDVNFQGLYNFDDIDMETDQVLYPADSAAVFFAALMAHALTADAMKNSAMSEAQKQANKVLSPYRKHLQKFENAELVSCVINNVNNKYEFKITQYRNNKSATGWLLKSRPVFFMTQDQRELILKHVMYVYRLAEPDVVVHKNIIEISSSRTDENYPLNFWIHKNNLPAVSSELYARSIKLFIDDMLAKNDSRRDTKQKTFRYTLGGVKKFERGTLVSEECGQTTMRTLRGWIKAFPSNNTDSAAFKNDCVKLSYVDNKVLVDIFK